MQQTERENFFLSKWVPLRLITALLIILFAAGIAGNALDNMAVREQKKTFNKQQALQAELAATALSDKFDNITGTIQLLTRYSIRDFIEGRRSRESLLELLRIQLIENKSLIYFSLYTQPDKQAISTSVTSPKLITAYDISGEWVSRYFSTISGMRSGFITPRSLISSKVKLAGILTPIWIDKKFAGVLVVVIDLLQLTEKYIIPLQFGKFGSGFIIDGSGTVIFDQETQIVGKNIFDLHKDFPELIKLDSTILRNKKGKGEYSFFLKRGKQKAKKIIAWDSAWLGEMKFVIAVSTPESDISNWFASTRISRIAIVGSMGLTIFIVIFFFYYYRSKQILLAQNNELKDKDKFFAAIAENVPGAIYRCELTPPFTLQYISPKIQELTGYNQYDFQYGGLSLFTDLIHPDDRTALKLAIENAFSDGCSFEATYRITHLDGSTRLLHERGIKQNEQNCITGLLLDITKQDEQKQSLKAIQEKYRATINSAPIGIYQSTPDGKFKSVNQQLAEFYGYSSPEDLIREINDIPTQCYVSLEDYDRLKTILKTFGKCTNFEAQHVRRTGSTFWASETVRAITDKNGKIVRHEGFLTNISERKEHEETMRRLAMYDNLTGLPNRVLLEERMKQAISYTGRTGLQMAVLYADLDNFKPVNDEQGHIAGDTILKEVAGRFSDCLRTSDTVSRIGGDEFVFILQDIGSKTEVEVVAQRVISATQAPFYVGEKIYRLGVSIGISIYPCKDTDKDSLIRLADEAMYRAKAAGKNKYSY